MWEFVLLTKRTGKSRCGLWAVFILFLGDEYPQNVHDVFDIARVGEIPGIAEATQSYQYSPFSLAITVGIMIRALFFNGISESTPTVPRSRKRRTCPSTKKFILRAAEYERA